MQLKEAISSVLATTKQETDTYDPWSWVEASVWTKAMLRALEILFITKATWFMLFMQNPQQWYLSLCGYCAIARYR